MNKAKGWNELGWKEQVAIIVEEVGKNLEAWGRGVPSQAALPRAHAAAMADDLAEALDKHVHGNPPLWHAADRNDTAAIARLLNKDKVDVNAVGLRGVTPLIVAAERGHSEAVSALLKAGADVNHKDNRGKTALDVAKDGHHSKVVKILTEAPAAVAVAEPEPDPEQAMRASKNKKRGKKSKKKREKKSKRRNSYKHRNTKRRKTKHRNTKLKARKYN